MKIDFRPANKFAKVLVGETISNDQKSVERFFAYEKLSKNPHNNKIMVMRQTISDTKIGWLVTDMEVFDSKTGKVVKSLKRNVGKKGVFDTILMYVDECGKNQYKKIKHLAKK